jgi:hypothetical protein
MERIFTLSSDNKFDEFIVTAHIEKLLDMAKEYVSIVLSDIFKIEECGAGYDHANNTVGITIQAVHSEHNENFAEFFFLLTDDQVKNIITLNNFAAEIRTGKE